MKFSKRLQYNAPVTLTFFFASLAALVYGFESEEIKRMVAAMDKSAVQTIKTKDETTNSHWGRQLQRHFLIPTPVQIKPRTHGI